jgi:hypothetical protein
MLNSTNNSVNTGTKNSGGVCEDLNNLMINIFSATLRLRISVFEFYYFCQKLLNMLNSFWHGIAAFFEFIFELAKPLGKSIDIIFMVLIAIGLLYWLIYEKRVISGKTRNYLADKVKEKSK